MELRDLIVKLTKRWKLLMTGILMGIIVGYGVFLLPTRYKALGSLYIFRDVQPSKDGSFSYEGYYSQQVAISYAKTLVALIESPDVRGKALSKLQIPTTETTLRKVKKRIKASITGPQLVTLRTKGKTPQEAGTLWSAISEAVQGVATDESLQINTLTEKPLVIKTFKDPFVFVFVSGLAGFGVALAFISFYEYLKRSENEL